MATPTAAEITFICVDTSYFLHKDHPFIKAQMEAIKQYSTVKLKCNPENRVGIFRMAGRYDGFDLAPTSNLEQILRCVEGLPSRIGGVVNFQDAVADVTLFRRWIPSNMERRLLVFVGSPINLYFGNVLSLGMVLKEMDIALDVVNFFVLEKDMLRLYNSVLYEKFQYGRRELAELVSIVNGKDNSHMVDVDVGEASVCDILSKSILKKNLRYLRKKNEKKANKSVNVKQELEPSRNEKNKAAAEYGKQSLSAKLNVNDTDKSRMIDSVCNKVSGSVPKKNTGTSEE